MYPEVRTWAKGCVSTLAPYVRAFAGPPGNWDLIPQEMAASPSHRPQLRKTRSTAIPTRRFTCPSEQASPTSPDPQPLGPPSPSPSTHLSKLEHTASCPVHMPLICTLVPRLSIRPQICTFVPQSPQNLCKRACPSRQTHSDHTHILPSYTPPLFLNTHPSPPAICTYGPLSCTLEAPHPLSVRTVPFSHSVLVSAHKTSPACRVQAVDPRSPAEPQVSA